jgi:hypothetical protein
MASRHSVIVLLFCCLWGSSMAQVSERIAKPIPASYCISTMEYKLYTMINDYRNRYDLPPIPLSKSLCYVASTHVNDLFYHHPDQGPCNAHSWSSHGNWKPFCYPRDENKKNSVWDKPEELTPYKGKGYEIVYWENDAAVIDSIITLWKSMDYFNSFLMNTGKWQGKKWNAIGIGIHENYACAWFGELPDPEGEPILCGQVSPNNSFVPKEKPGLIGKKEPEKKGVPQKKVPFEEPKKVNPPAPKLVSTLATTGTNYYIIVKGVAPDKELQHFLKDLQLKGYSSSKLVEKNGKQRVSIMEFHEKSKADSALRQIKKTWQDAWLLEK